MVFETPEESQTAGAERGPVLHIEDGRGTVYPILTLPTETTAEIFMHCLPDVPSLPRIDTAPLLLGRICSKWRIISLTTPQLWSSLTFRNHTLGLPVHTVVELIETWLARARTCPLFLRVVVHPPRWGEQFFDILKRHSHTWRDVEFDIPFEQLERFGRDLPLPMLERLAIHVASRLSSNPVEAFQAAPALRHLHLLDAASALVVAFPWAQLASLAIKRGASHHCLSILSLTPNLVDCTLTTYFQREQPLLDVVVPLLDSLHISCRGELDILNHISAPALKVLNLEHFFRGPGLLPLYRFASQPGCRLRELTIRAFDYDAAALTAVLETQSALEKLELWGARHDLLSVISRRLGNVDLPFLPRIVYFGAKTCLARIDLDLVEYRSMIEGMLDALVGALSARLGAPREFITLIKYFRITCGPDISKDFSHLLDAFQPQFEELAAKGTNIDIEIIQE
ncbi:hypothetical protein DFH07DRAFT_924816 [Mycena maculata]|uniref:F-box domain-containing protein n=1 Tax=Mycena maculata TaxID=230809 RepID=A0AAD7IKK2_9AGAR|nr:hypothetical protein DFH07DRAFT_924816 [Mycena maculata]